MHSLQVPQHRFPVTIGFLTAFEWARVLVVDRVDVERLAIRDELGKLGMTARAVTTQGVQGVERLRATVADKGHFG